MNPLKSKNVVAKILQVYAYLNTAAGVIVALLLGKELGKLDTAVATYVAIYFFAAVLVASFLIFALGEIIDLLQNVKENTSKKVEISDELPDL